MGGNLRQVVVFRRGDDWRLLATMLDLQPGSMAISLARKAEIWLSDSDVVLVPKGPILVATSSSTSSSPGESTGSSLQFVADFHQHGDAIDLVDGRA